LAMDKKPPAKQGVKWRQLRGPRGLLPGPGRAAEHFARPRTTDGTANTCATVSLWAGGRCARPPMEASESVRRAATSGTGPPRTSCTTRIRATGHGALTPAPGDGQAGPSPILSCPRRNPAQGLGATRVSPKLRGGLGALNTQGLFRGPRLQGAARRPPAGVPLATSLPSVGRAHREGSGVPLKADVHAPHRRG